MKSAILMKMSVLLSSILFFALPSSMVAQTGDVVVSSNTNWVAGSYPTAFRSTSASSRTSTEAGRSTKTTSLTRRQRQL
jgi:hypothetical protein